MNNDSNTTAFPLCWPAGHTRFVGEKRQWSQPPTPGEARDQLFRELGKMGATEVVLSTNVETTKGHTFHARYKEPADNGVAVYFKWKGEDKVFACDCYAKMSMNIRAISLTLDEMRRISKRGVADFENKAFTGFAALHQGSIDTINWWTILQCEQTSDHETVKRSYRALCKEFHPDTGVFPDSIKFHDVVKAWDAFLKTIERHE